MVSLAIFLVTTFACREWLLSAPAALWCDIRFSGSLFGSEPSLSIAPYNYIRTNH
ncbi:unnamed protein product, partial [Thelazia callipaeda]|uniref:Secreted protein n=1 Tax=Thelazia callipaeda TaxID=103827 RepID=A0A0N5CTG5_THECL